MCHLEKFVVLINGKSTWMSIFTFPILVDGRRINTSSQLGGKGKKSKMYTSIHTSQTYTTIIC